MLRESHHSLLRVAAAMAICTRFVTLYLFRLCQVVNYRSVFVPTTKINNFCYKRQQSTLDHTIVTNSRSKCTFFYLLCGFESFTYESLHRYAYSTYNQRNATDLSLIASRSTILRQVSTLGVLPYSNKQTIMNFGKFTKHCKLNNQCKIHTFYSKSSISAFSTSTRINNQNKINNQQNAMSQRSFLQVSVYFRF